MEEYINKTALVAEIENKIKKYTKRGEESDAKRDGYGMYWGGVLSCLNEIRTLCDTLEAKEVDLKQKSFVKIDRKLLFEICDAILEHEGYCDRDDCYDSEYPYCAHPWDEKFRKKVENIRRNS